MADEGAVQTESEEAGWFASKGINIFLSCVVAMAIIGFFVGTSSDHYDAQLAGFGDDDRPEQQVEPARSYSELMADPYQGNPHWEEELKRLSELRPDPHDEVERSDEMTNQALADRIEHRAYEGAPPTVPHAVRETGATECMACHGEGLRVTERLATVMSHEYMTNCTQCHVVEEASIPTPDSRYDELPLDNAFVGLQRWGEGDRAQPGAPPVTPHPVNLREDCTSCHGTMARPGIRTTHPWKTQCVQCHAPGATLDQRPMMEGLPEVGSFHE